MPLGDIMLSLIINDVPIEVTIKYKNATISYYVVDIVGYDTIEILGSREFGAMVSLIENEVLKAMSNIDSFSCGYYHD